MRVQKSRSIITVGIALLLALAQPGRCDEPSREYLLKAAFIFNFMQFVEWPANSFSNADAPFVVGIVGADPFNGALERAVAGKSAANRQVVVKHYAAGEQIGKCQLVFIAGNDAATSEFLKRVAGGPVLTVGESDSFPWNGGDIRFFVEDNKIRFEINMDAVNASGLKVSAKLQKLARIFHR